MALLLLGRQRAVAGAPGLQRDLDEVDRIVDVERARQALRLLRPADRGAGIAGEHAALDQKPAERAHARQLAARSWPAPLCRTARRAGCGSRAPTASRAAGRPCRRACRRGARAAPRRRAGRPRRSSPSTRARSRGTSRTPRAP